MPTSLDHCLKLHPWLGALLLVAMLAALPAADTDAKEKKHISLSPVEEYNVSLEATRNTMDHAQTQRDVSKFVGGPPIHCVNGAKDSTLCVWPLSKKQQGWWPLGGISCAQGDRLNLICEFPANDEPRPTDSCSVHSQRSNRGMIKGTTKVPTRGRMPRGVSNKSLAVKKMAAQLLDQSKTAFQLSTLVGDAPYSCFNASAFIHGLPLEDPQRHLRARHPRPPDRDRFWRTAWFYSANSPATAPPAAPTPARSKSGASANARAIARI